ncbi:MAG: LysM peptidoglycan-binding domain-containing protein [Cyanobacteria bacterium SZAS-4]|nr:LysM peptidoglycan-binding domain-containing protein [Cyanobacteria bacterium SZAS-4]
MFGTSCPVIALADHCAVQPVKNFANVMPRSSVNATESIVSTVPSKPVQVRTGPRQLHKFVAKVALPDNPSDLDLSTAHLLPEPLVPMHGTAVASENAALAKAVMAFKNRNDNENLSELDQFASNNADSRWLPSLQLNMALIRFRTGHLSRALQLFSSVWEQSKKETGTSQKAVADRAVAMLCIINARLGRKAELSALLNEISSRALFGSDEQMVKDASAGLGLMQVEPQNSFKCGPYAVGNLLSQAQLTKVSKLIEDAKSTESGTNLAQVKDLADRVGLKMQMAKKSSGAALIVPSIIHWKLSHFSALTGKSQGIVVVKDPTFASDGVFGATEKTLDEESDGYFLVPAGSLPAGWAKVTREEGEKVWGKGAAGGHSGNCMRGPAPRLPDSCPAGGGMARASMWAMNTCLNINDTPLSYTPPLGDPINFNVNYNQEETNQPGSYTFTNLGFNWKFYYCSYLTVGAGSQLTVRVPGGGTEVANLSGGVYIADQLSQAQMVNTGTTYERRMPDGAVQVYDLTDTNGNWFMTKMTDPQGNSVLIQYDVNFRITTITDAIGQVSTLSYVSNTVGNSGFYKLASIADPFSRTCSFSYDSTNTRLLSITDVISLTSKFVYDPNSSFITAMTTPYGTTSFQQYVPGNNGYPARGLRLTYPDQTTLVLENWLNETKTSYYWDREATDRYPSDPINKDYTHCRQMRWTLDFATGLEGPAPQSTKDPLEAGTTYLTYPNQISPNYRGSIDKPNQTNQSTGTQTDVVTLSGTATPGNVVAVEIVGVGATTPVYTVVGGDTLNSIATNFANVINSSAAVQAVGKVTAVAAGASIYLSADYPGVNVVVQPAGGATQPLTLKSAQRQTMAITVGGTAVTGDFANLFLTSSFSSPVISYHVVAGDTLTNIAAGIAALINSNTTYQAYFITATSSGPVVNVTSYNWATTGTNIANSAYTLTPSLLRNGAARTTDYQYNTLGKVTQSVDPQNRTFSYQYAANNIDLTQITETQRGNSRFMGGWTYDSHHRPLTYTDGSGQVTNYSYNGAEQLLTVTDANSNVTTMTYTSNYLTKIDGPLAGSNDITTFAYDSYGRLSQTTDSEGYTVVSSFDNANRLVQTLYPDGSTEQIVYDRLDAVLQKDRIGRTAQDAYDSMQRHAYQIDPLGRKTTYTWCDCGSLGALTDPMGRVTTWQHDLQGRPILKTYADGTAVKYEYEGFASRLKFKTDALSQKTVYMFNSDDTQNVVGYLNAVNPTSSVVYAWDANYKRLASVAKPDWGTYSYTYNNYIAPGGTATTGGGMLSLIHNDVIPNSDISYSYDVLGRTTNRSINGASNSVTWSYDAMSRITQEANALGNFGYAYVDNTVGSSKGTTRLSSITYPNSQVTNFSWFPNVGDQRLQQISNLNPTGGRLSQFDYQYDSAGQITQWQQQQNGGNLFYNLGYDAAGQLTSAQAGSGAPQSPFAKEFYYGYDAASNRTSVQMNSISTARIGGTKTTGNVLTITAFDAALSGGSKAVSYTVLAGDTLATIAQGLATAINNDSSLRTAGITANANSTNTYINIKSASNNITTYTSSVVGTETITFGIFKNALENIIIGGSKTTGDIITITVKDPALTGGQRSVTYTTLAGDTLTTIATGVKNAINADAQLTTLGVSATSAAAVVSVTSNSTNATGYASSVSGSATELITLSVNPNQNQLATIGGTKTTGDVITLTVFDAGLPSGKQAIPYTVLAGDTLTTIATGVAAAVNANTNLQNSGITATSTGAVVTLQSKSPNSTTYRQSFNSTATENMLIAPAKFGWQVVAIGGTKTTGNVVTVNVYDIGLAGGSKPISYTVLAADTLSTIATNLAAAINADATLTALGVTATASSTVVSLKSLSPNLTTYVTSKSAGATETLTLGTGIGVLQSTYNNVNELKSITAGGSTFFKGDTDKPVSSATLATPVLDVRSSLPSTATSFSARSNRTATETLTIAYTPGQWIFGPMYKLTVGGTVTVGDTLSLTISDVRLQSGSETVSYTTKAGDTTTTVATGLSNAISQNAPLSALITTGINLSGNSFGIGTSAAANAQPNPFGVVGTVTEAGSESIALASASDESTTATITGTVTTGDVLSIVVQNANLVSGQKTIQYTVVGGDTTTTIATALKNAINADTSLQGVGVQATSAANIVTLNPYTYFTGSSSGTETVSISNANRGSAAITIGGAVTTSNTVTITARSPLLAGGLKNIVYTVVSGDTLTSISKALADLINADSTLKALGIKVSNAATLAWSQSFSGNALLPTGSSLVSATAVDGSSNTKTNGYALSVNVATSSTLTYDLNGNMLSDGTNSYSWDAENRMIKITYPGSNNFSTFVYDGLSRNVSIVETTAGSVTSTKQFVWAMDKMRTFKACEERDGTGTLTKKFFNRGQMNSATKYFYDLDHLGSVRELMDNSGVTQAQYAFDPYGRVTKISETVGSDFGYAGYYLHARSGLNLTRTRSYSSGLGRWINRDPLTERGGVNLYDYVSNYPVGYTDSSGLQGAGVSIPPSNPGNPNPNPAQRACTARFGCSSYCNYMDTLQYMDFFTCFFLCINGGSHPPAQNDPSPSPSDHVTPNPYAPIAPELHGWEGSDQFTPT